MCSLDVTLVRIFIHSSFLSVARNFVRASVPSLVSSLVRYQTFAKKFCVVTTTNCKLKLAPDLSYTGLEQACTGLKESLCYYLDEPLITVLLVFGSIYHKHCYVLVNFSHLKSI